MAKAGNRYSQLIEYIFLENYRNEAQEVNFRREDLVSAAKELGIALPKNLGDVIYSFRYRTALPESIRKLAPDGLEWVIRSVGQAKYKFSLTAMPRKRLHTIEGIGEDQEVSGQEHDKYL